MKKFLKMNETIIDKETGIKFNEDESYEVVFECHDGYILPNQNGIPCGIGKEGKDIRYIEIIKE